MYCRECKTEILPAFKHALVQNECPACGNQIMDEEMLVIIEDLEKTILLEASVRKETAHKLAMAIVTKYTIDLGTQPPSAVSEPQVKIAPPSAAQQVTKKEEENIVKLQDLVAEGVSDFEKERIMEEAVKERYGLVDQVHTGIDDDGASSNFEGASASPFSESDDNPVLEKERLLRLAKQNQAMKSGTSSFRRSS